MRYVIWAVWVSEWVSECKTVFVAQWLSTGFSPGRPWFNITARPPLEILKVTPGSKCCLCHHTCEWLEFLFFYDFYGFFKDYEPEVPSHNFFESQLCGTLKNAHAIRKEKGTEFPVLWFVLHSSKKRHGVFFLSRRAMAILKVWYVCQIVCIAGDIQRQNKLWARHLVASGSFIRMSIVNDTLPPGNLTWMKITPFFPGKLLKSNFVTFLVLVDLDFS